MKASALTPQDYVGLLPLVLARRYQSPFAVKKLNEILSEIEQACDPDYMVGETGLLLLSGVTDYPLPAAVRHIKGLYAVPPGDVIPDRNHSIGHIIMGSKVRLDAVISLSEDEDITGTVPASPPSDLTKVYDTTAGKLDSALEDDALAGRLVRVTHAGGAVEYRILKGNTPDDHTADINGALDAQAAAGEAYLITANFLIIEHQRYLTRVTTSTYQSAALDVPQDFENLVQAGLTYKYNLQADSLSKETRKWEEEYATLMNNYKVDTTKIRGTSIRNIPRSMPSIS